MIDKIGELLEDVNTQRWRADRADKMEEIDAILDRQKRMLLIMKEMAQAHTVYSKPLTTKQVGAFISRLRTARARAGMSMREVAEACGCSAQAVHMWEAGKARPRMERLTAICSVLDVTVEWMTRDTPPELK